jgi:hypothetical protein
MSDLDSGGVAGVVACMQQCLDGLAPGEHGCREFLATYLRTTIAVGEAIESGVFEDARWVKAWDVAFAGLYLDALAAHLAGVRPVPTPWRLAFDAPADLPAVRHVLLGINAHINYDLPQALLLVIDDQDFADQDVLNRRRRDHERIDAVLSTRVTAENRELAAQSQITLLDRAMRPANRIASRRFLREARRKVWYNTMELQRARLVGAETYATRLGELEALSAARIADLLAPGPVMLRLAIVGSGIALPPAS